MLALDKTWADCWDEEEKAFILGDGITVRRIRTNDINLGQTYPAGTKVTISWKHKGYFWSFALFYYDSNAGYFVGWNKDSDEIEVKGDASLDYWKNTRILHIKLNGIKPNTSEAKKLFDRWYNVEITYTLPVETDKLRLVFDGYGAYKVNTVGLLRHIQVEVKPFATSFVDGTRADGRLAIPINFRTNLVISGWFKPYGTSGNYNTQGGWARIVNFSNSNDTRRVTLAYNRRDSHPDFQKFQLSIYNASGDVIVSTSNVYPFNKWYFWVLIIEDASTTAYIFDENGNMEKIVNTNSIPLSDISSSPLYIGHRTTGTTDVLNGVISNLLIARYDPTIWTDEYIRFLYETQKPFFV
jgi:hypothetical protein